MLDDLRNSSYLDEEEEEVKQQEETRAAVARPVRRKKKKNFLGMTAQERFVLSLMLFMLICVLGAFALVLTKSVVLPF